MPFPEIRPVLARELHAALINRYLQVFSLLALACGVGGVFLSETAEAAAFFALQVSLYFVPLFAVLLGVSSARMESEEWPALFSQPVARSALLAGKFLAGWGMFALVLGLLFAPALVSGSAPLPMTRIYASGLGLSAVFVSLGLWVGFRARDRVQALIAGIVAWLALLLGFDLAATALAHFVFFQKFPDFWVALLMLNPVDAFRIQALFALEQIPAETASKTPFAGLWLQHAGAWFALTSALWTAALLAVAARRMERMEA